MSKTVKIAEKAGFCFGVSRAVRITQEGIDNGKKIATLGPIIHNSSVVESFNRQGARIIESSSDALQGETVIIRSHGIKKSEQEVLEKNGIEFIDATCPFVKKIHNIVAEAYENKYDIVIIGDKNHPEVIGINGWCEDSATVIDSEEQARNLEFQAEKTVYIVAQTTFERELWKKITKISKKTCLRIITSTF